MFLPFFILILDSWRFARILSGFYRFCSVFGLISDVDHHLMKAPFHYASE